MSEAFHSPSCSRLAEDSSQRICTGCYEHDCECCQCTVIHEWGHMAPVLGPATTHDFQWVILGALRSLQNQKPGATPIEVTAKVRTPRFPIPGEPEGTQSIMALIKYEVADEQP